ncbi:hypothetical protein EXVG_00033 [Emiliania huxleyi virus 202]|nr:hypothetical protein EXVG_00033 [Emiliania huxleyi virus 202]AHA54520.1 hypothetical protein EhV18_00474 [Emiliania huxleyi virus 18]AHA55559.1 hypothetical protein EhV156_00464 [Emiliania huxleyi virus 156]
MYRSALASYEEIKWIKCPTHGECLLFKNNMYPNGDLLKRKQCNTCESCVVTSILPKLNTDHIVFDDSKKIGGLGNHIRLYLQTSTASEPISLLVLNISCIQKQSNLERFVAQTQCLSLKEECDPYYDFNGDVAAGLVLDTPSKLSTIILQLAMLDISCVSFDTEDSITVLADKFTRTYSMFTYNKDHALNKPSREPQNWKAVSYLGSQHYTAESLGRAIAKTKNLPSLYDDNIPEILTRVIHTQSAALESNNSSKTQITTAKIKGDTIPRICYDYQKLVTMAYVINKYANLPEYTAQINAIFLFFGMHGYLVRQLGAYVRSDKYRGTGKNVRTFAGEDEGSENIDEYSLKRLKKIGGKWRGLKYSE